MSRVVRAAALPARRSSLWLELVTVFAGPARGRDGDRRPRALVRFATAAVDSVVRIHGAVSAPVGACAGAAVPALSLPALSRALSGAPVTAACRPANRQCNRGSRPSPARTCRRARAAEPRFDARRAASAADAGRAPAPFPRTGCLRSRAPSAPSRRSARRRRCRASAWGQGQRRSYRMQARPTGVSGSQAMNFWSS